MTEVRGWEPEGRSYIGSVGWQTHVADPVLCIAVVNPLVLWLVLGFKGWIGHWMVVL